MELVYDIFDNCNLIKNFCKLHNIQENDYNNIFENYFKYNDLPLYLMNMEQNNEYIDFKMLNIGDNIIVNCMPYSQKYLEYYESKEVKGKIFYLDTKNCNGLIYYDIIINNKIIRHINSIEKEYCSYFGDSPGYTMFIYKLNIL